MVRRWVIGTLFLIAKRVLDASVIKRRDKESWSGAIELRELCMGTSCSNLDKGCKVQSPGKNAGKQSESDAKAINV